MKGDETKAGAATQAPDERELVQRAAQGDRNAFNRLVLAHQDRIMTLCSRMLGNREEAEEAAQDSFVRAFENLGRFKGEAMFSTWLYQIAVNACRNRRRSWWWRVRKRSVDVEEPADPETDMPRREFGDTRLSPEKDLQRHRTAAAIQRALATLPGIHRELIVLRDMQDMAYEDIAASLGISLGTVKSRLARAREAMQEQLRGVVDGA
jgi:RNA polymerase sigma-70 factor, ECF subfamily